MAKLNDRCLCYCTAAMLVPLRRAPTWRLHTKIYKFGWNTFPNNARMNNRTDLNLGEVIYISIIFHIPASWLSLLNGYDFYLWWRDIANQPYNTREFLIILIRFVMCLFRKLILNNIEQFFPFFVMLFCYFVWQSVESPNLV